MSKCRNWQFRSECSCSGRQGRRFSVDQWRRTNPLKMSTTAFLKDKFGRWFPRDNALSWDFLSLKITDQRCIAHYTEIMIKMLSHLLMKLHRQSWTYDDIWWRVCFMTLMALFTSCRQCYVVQQVFYILVLAVSPNNTNIYRTNAILSYPCCRKTVV